LEKVTDFSEISIDDKKDLLQLLNEMKESNDLDLKLAKDITIKALEDKPNN